MHTTRLTATRAHTQAMRVLEQQEANMHEAKVPSAPAQQIDSLPVAGTHPTSATGASGTQSALQWPVPEQTHVPGLNTGMASYSCCTPCVGGNPLVGPSSGTVPWRPLGPRTSGSWVQRTAQSHQRPQRRLCKLHL
eukprot:6352151-Amphidinium_carterae.1